MGLVDWWAGEGDALDLVGGDGGQFTGPSISATAPGRVGLCFQLNSAGDAVVVGNPAQLQLQSFTIEAWVRRGSATRSSPDSVPNGMIFGYGYNGYAFGMFDDGRLVLTKVGVSSANSTATVTDTAWHHLAVTKAGGDVRFYIDGRGEAVPPYDPGFAFSSVAMIGAIGLESVRATFLGSLDEVSVYNRALSDVEVQLIFDAAGAGKCRPAAVTLSPGSGLFADSAVVTMVATTTNGTIRYTLDGSEPLADSTAYTGPLTVTNTVGIQAQLFDRTFPISAIASTTLVKQPPAFECRSTNLLVSWWPGEGSPDDIFGQNHGSLVGPINYLAGQTGRAFDFAGAGAGVVLGNLPSLQLQSFTIEAWFKRIQFDVVTPGNSGNGIIFGYGSGGYAFGMYNDGRMLLTKVGASAVDSPLAVQDADWHHVAVTKAGDRVVFYLDGVADAGRTYDPGFTFGTNPAIGEAGPGGPGLLGLLDEVKVYDQGLSASQVQFLYYSSAFKRCHPESVTISPAGGGFTNSVLLTLSGSTTNAVLRYTLDGSVPGPFSPAYNGPLLLTNTTIVHAQLFDEGGPISPVTDATFYPRGCLPISADLAAWWPADGSAVEIVQRIDGLPTGPVIFSPGKIGQAFNFAGTGAGVLVGNPPALQLQSFTVEAWIRRSRADIASPDSPGSGTVFGYGWNGYAFGVLNGGRLFLTKVGVGAINSSLMVSDTGWHHVAVTKSGAAVIFYVDGIEDQAQAYDPGFAFTTLASIGAAGQTGASFLGLVDEVKVHNRSLSPDEVLALYYNGAFSQCLPPTVDITPDGGPFSSSVTVTLTTTADTGVIRYTLDGSRPTPDSAAYQGPLTLTNSTVVQAQLFSGDLPASPYATAVFYQQGCVTPQAGLVGWWAGEGTGSDWIRHNDANLTGPVLLTAGKVGQAFQFTGSSAAAFLGNPATLQLQSFTIEAWVRRSRADVATASGSENGAIFGYGVYGYVFAMLNDGHLLLSKVGSSRAVSLLAVTDTGWHHVAVTKNGPIVVFFLDGDSDAGQSYDPGFSFTSPAAIGAAGDTGSSFFGLIDEVSIYNRALSEAELLTVYGAGSLGKCTNFAPRIFLQPQDQNVALGSNLVLNVAASSAVPLQYQWRRGGDDIAGATGSSFALIAVGDAAAGRYSVVVSNAYGFARSTEALVVVSVPPVITVQPQNQTVLVGSNAVFRVTAEGSPELTYQWTYNGQPIPGVTGAILVVNGIQFGHAGSYAVSVSNPAGSALSDPARLTVASGALSILAASGPVQLNVLGEAGVGYTIETSSDLVHWSSLVSELNVPVSWQFLDPAPAAPGQRFYRLRKN